MSEACPGEGAARIGNLSRRSNSGHSRDFRFSAPPRQWGIHPIDRNQPIQQLASGDRLRGATTEWSTHTGNIGSIVSAGVCTGRDLKLTSRNDIASAKDHSLLPRSRHFATSTNAFPWASAANGFSNLQCYWLGLNPTDPDSTFRAQASLQSGTGYPQIRWASVGGRRYAVEYADSLVVSGASFIPVLTVTETNVAAGVESTATFVDDYTLTGNPPGAKGRFYRIRLASQ